LPPEGIIQFIRARSEIAKEAIRGRRRFVAAIEMTGMADTDFVVAGKMIISSRETSPFGQKSGTCVSPVALPEKGSVNKY
jgi:hypothetical protein